MHGNQHRDRVLPRERKTARDVVARYLRLENLNNGAFKRFGRYEAKLWRQARGIIAKLEAIRGSYSMASSLPLHRAITLRDDFPAWPPNRLW